MVREWSQPKRQFYQYRWLTLVDQSCTQALAVKLYTNSQQAQLEEIRVATVVYLSNLTIQTTNSPTASMPSARSIVAKSTNYTQILDQPAQEQTQHPYLLALIKWSQEVNHGEFAFYPSLYIWSFDFEHYKSLFSSTITPIRELPLLQHTLRYQQLKGTLIQGFLLDLIIHPAGLRPISDGVMDENDYADAWKRLYPETLEIPQPMVDVTPSQSQVTDMDLSQSSIGSRLRLRGTRSQAQSREEESVPASQSSTTSRRGRSRATSAADKNHVATRTRSSSTSASPSKSKTNVKGKRSRSTTRASSKTTKKQSTSGRNRRGRSASVASSPSVSPTREGRRITRSGRGRTVEPSVSPTGRVTIVRKRKATRSPVDEAASSEQIPASASPSLSAPIAVPVPSAAPTPTPIPHPSLPSVLATLILRDLNGESVIELELHDPIVAHANFEAAKGNLAQECQTPKEAARVRQQNQKRLGSQTRKGYWRSISHLIFFCPVFPFRLLSGFSWSLTSPSCWFLYSIRLELSSHRGLFGITAGV